MKHELEVGDFVKYAGKNRFIYGILKDDIGMIWHLTYYPMGNSTVYHVFYAGIPHHMTVDKLWPFIEKQIVKV